VFPCAVTRWQSSTEVSFLAGAIMIVVGVRKRGEGMNGARKI
jgi:hypothetical protein